jgi:hypothetical protein
MPAEGMNGTNGFKTLTRNGEKIAKKEVDIAHYQSLTSFPKSLLHPAIAAKVYDAIIRNDLDEAVGFAFRKVERRCVRLENTGTVPMMWAEMTACVEAANQAKLPVAGIPGRSLNTWVQFVCVPAKPIVP